MPYDPHQHIVAKTTTLTLLGMTPAQAMALHDLSARYDVAEVKFGLGGGGLHRSYVGFTLIDGKGDVSLCGGIDTEGGIST